MTPADGGRLGVDIRNLTSWAKDWTKMSAKQDKNVLPATAVDEISWLRDDGNGRIVADGTKLSVHERLEYAFSLVPAKRWEGLIGRSPKQIKRYISGADIKLSVLTMVSVASGLPVEWLVTGRASPEWESTRADFTANAQVRKLCFFASAGRGVSFYEDEDIPVFLPRAILDKLHLKSDDARLLTAIGDSMRPTIEEGELLLVDIRQTDVVEGAIYVFTVGDDVMVKRLRRRGGKLLMRADNKELYPDEEEVPTVEPVRIIGRVRWVGRSL